MGRKEDRASIAGPSCSTFSQVSCVKSKISKIGHCYWWMGGGLYALGWEQSSTRVGVDAEVALRKRRAP